MNEKLIDAIVQLAQQGGTVAIWLFAIHILGGVLKFVVAFGCILLSVTKICNVLRISYNECGTNENKHN
jgi:hypothetical protein